LDKQKLNPNRVTRAALLLAALFAVDKVVAVVRQVLIVRQYEFSAELDAFNIANNVPDMLFLLISGGGLAMAFIPVLSETLSRDGRRAAWDLFSRIANLAFLVTLILAAIIALLADGIVGSVVASGFTPEQQHLVTGLMRLNLIATMIFSLSGLVVAGLHTNQHFLLPALAPILYNIGQIIGALFFSPLEGLTIAGVTLPTLGLGVRGLVYGVILGACLHLGIQLPGLIRYGFHWTRQIGIRLRVRARFKLSLEGPEGVIKVLRLMGPRIVTIFFIQLVFLARDNIASWYSEGAVSALTYAWMLMQVPETLIGTAIGVAILPTLAELSTLGQWEEFKQSVQRAVRVLVALTLPVAAILAVGIGPLMILVFGLDGDDNTLLLWTTRGYFAALTGHALMEVASRSHYAAQDARTPMITGAINLAVYLILGLTLANFLGAPGLSLAEAGAFTLQAVLLYILLNRKLPQKLQVGGSLLRGGLAALLGAGLALGTLNLLAPHLGETIASVIAMLAGLALSLGVIWREVRLLLRL
jgi:putative peptidoglycan lipid II flippase